MGVPLLDSIRTHAELVIRESIAPDVVDMAPRLRIPDMAEIAAATGEKPVVALGRGFASSVPCYTAVFKGRPAAMFGVVPMRMDAFPRTGSIWLLGTDDIPLFSKSFMRHTRPWLSIVCSGYDQVSNHVDARNRRHVVWLKRCGFLFLRTVKKGPYNLPFHEFTKVLSV